MSCANCGLGSDSVCDLRLPLIIVIVVTMPPPQLPLSTSPQKAHNSDRDCAKTIGLSSGVASNVDASTSKTQEEEKEVVDRIKATEENDCGCRHVVACCRESETRESEAEAGAKAEAEAEGGRGRSRGRRQVLKHLRQKTTKTTTAAATTTTASNLSSTPTSRSNSMSVSSASLSSMNFSICGANRSSSLSVDSNNRPTRTTSNNSRFEGICSASLSPTSVYSSSSSSSASLSYSHSRSQSPSPSPSQSQSITCSSCNNSQSSYYTGSCCANSDNNDADRELLNDAGGEIIGDGGSQAGVCGEFTWSAGGEEAGLSRLLGVGGEEEEVDKRKEEEDKSERIKQRRGTKNGLRSGKINRPITDIDNIKCDDLATATTTTNKNGKPTCSTMAQDVSEAKGKSDCGDKWAKRSRRKRKRKKESKKCTRFTSCPLNCRQQKPQQEQQQRSEERRQTGCHYETSRHHHCRSRLHHHGRHHRHNCSTHLKQRNSGCNYSANASPAEQRDGISTCNSELQIVSYYFNQKINRKQRSHSVGHNSYNKRNYYNVDSNSNTVAAKGGKFVRVVIPKFVYRHQQCVIQCRRGRNRRGGKTWKLGCKTEHESALKAYIGVTSSEETTAATRITTTDSGANSAEIKISKQQSQQQRLQQLTPRLQKQRQCAFEELSFKCPNCQVKLKSSEVIVDVPVSGSGSLSNSNLLSLNNEQETSSFENKPKAEVSAAGSINDKCKSSKLYTNQYSLTVNEDNNNKNNNKTTRERNSFSQFDTVQKQRQEQEQQQQKSPQTSKRRSFEFLFRSAFDSIVNVGVSVNKAPLVTPLLHKNKSKSNCDNQAATVATLLPVRSDAGLINQPPIRVEQEREEANNDNGIEGEESKQIRRRKGEEEGEEKFVRSSQVGSTTMVVISTTSANDNNQKCSSESGQEEEEEEGGGKNSNLLLTPNKQFNRKIGLGKENDSASKDKMSINNNLLNPMDIVHGRSPSNEIRALSCTETSMPSLLVAQLASNRSKSLCTNSQFEQFMKMNKSNGSGKGSNNRNNSNNAISSSNKSPRKLFAQNLGRKVTKLTRKAISRIRGLSISNPNLLVSQCDDSTIEQLSDDEQDDEDDDGNDKNGDKIRLRAISANISYDHAINIKRRASSQRAKCDNNGQMLPNIVPHQLNRFMSISSGGNLEQISTVISEREGDKARLLTTEVPSIEGKTRQQQLENDLDFDDQLFYSADGIYIGPGGICSWRDICASNKIKTTITGKTHQQHEKKRHKSLMVPSSGNTHATISLQSNNNTDNVNSSSSQGGTTSWLSRPFRLSVAQALLGSGQTNNSGSNNNNFNPQVVYSSSQENASTASGTATNFPTTTISCLANYTTQPLTTTGDQDVCPITQNTRPFTLDQQQQQQVQDFVIKVGRELALGNADSNRFKQDSKNHPQQQQKHQFASKRECDSDREFTCLDKQQQQQRQAVTRQTKVQDSPTSRLNREHQTKPQQQFQASLSNSTSSTILTVDGFWISNEDKLEDTEIESEEKSNKSQKQQQQQQQLVRQKFNNGKIVVRSSSSNRAVNNSWISSLTNRVHYQASSSPVSRVSPQAPRLIKKTQSNFRDSCNNTNLTGVNESCVNGDQLESSLGIDYTKLVPISKPTLAKENRSTSLSSLHRKYNKRRPTLSKSSMDLNYNQIVEQNNLYLAELNSRYSASTHELTPSSQQGIKSLDNNEGWFRRSFKNNSSQSQNINSNNIFSVNQIVSQQHLVLDQVESNSLLFRSPTTAHSTNFGFTGASSAANLKASMSEQTSNKNKQGRKQTQQQQQQPELYGANLQTICVHCQLIAELASYPSSSYLSQLLSSAPSTATTRSQQEVKQQQQQQQQQQSVVAIQTEIPIQPHGAPKSNKNSEESDNVDIRMAKSEVLAKTKPSVVLTVCSNRATIDDEEENSHSSSLIPLRGTQSSSVSVSVVDDEKSATSTNSPSSSARQSVKLEKSSSLRSSLKSGSRSGCKKRGSKREGNQCRYSSFASLISKSSLEQSEKSSISCLDDTRQAEVNAATQLRRSSANLEDRGEPEVGADDEEEEEEEVEDEEVEEVEDEEVEEVGEVEEEDDEEEGGDEEEEEANTSGESNDDHFNAEEVDEDDSGDDSAELDDLEDKSNDDGLNVDDNQNVRVQVDSEKGADTDSLIYEGQELASEVNLEYNSRSESKLESRSKSKSKSKFDAESKSLHNLSSSSSSSSSPTTSAASTSPSANSSPSSNTTASSYENLNRAYLSSDNLGPKKARSSCNDFLGDELLVKETVSGDGSSLELLLIDSSEKYKKFTAVNSSFGSVENSNGDDDAREKLACQSSSRQVRSSKDKVNKTRATKMATRQAKVGRNKRVAEESGFSLSRKQVEKVKNKKKSTAESTKERSMKDEVEVEEASGKKNESKGLVAVTVADVDVDATVEDGSNRIKKDEIETKSESRDGSNKKVKSRENNNLKTEQRKGEESKQRLLLLLLQKKKKKEKMEGGRSKKVRSSAKRGEDDEIGELNIEVEDEAEMGEQDGDEEEEENDDDDEDDGGVDDVGDSELELEYENNEDNVCSGRVVVLVDSESRSMVSQVTERETKTARGREIEASEKGTIGEKVVVKGRGKVNVRTKTKAKAKATNVVSTVTSTTTPTLSVTTNTLEVPANKQARSASLDAPYLLKVPTADELADFYDESYPSSKANRSRSVDISLPTKPGEYYTVCQLISSSGTQVGVSNEIERNKTRVADLRSVNESQKKFIQGEIKVACANGETRALKLFVDWQENCVNGEHLWIYVGSSSEACYVGENECLKHGPRLCCSACKITAHTSCISILIDKIKFICKHTFKDLTINNPRHLKELQQQNVIYHHWVHKRTHCGRCKHCTKTFGNTKLPFSSKEIQAITCSWCKISYHNKENCYTLSALTEPCTLGAHRESIIPPPWILKIPIPVTNNLPQPQHSINFSSNDENQNFKDANDHLHSDNLIDLSMTTLPNAFNKLRNSDNSNKENSEINLIDQRREQQQLNSANKNTGNNNNNQHHQIYGSNTTLMTDTSGYMSADGTNVQSFLSKNTNNSAKMLCESQHDRSRVGTHNADIPDATSDEIIMDPSALQVADLSLINQTSLNQQQQVRGRQHPQENLSQYHKHQLKQYYKQIDANQNSEQPFKMVGDHDNEDPATLVQIQAMQQQNKQMDTNLYNHFKIFPQPIQGIPNAGSKPVLVFVNPRSGGNQGAKMMQKFNWLLNPRQVFDLIQSDGPRTALELYRDVPNLRILTIGGDGTASWILSELDEVGIVNRIPVAVLPLGTGNDLARALGWGGGYTDEPIAKILTQVRDGEVVQLDRWNLQVERNFEVTPSSPSEFSSTSNLGAYPASTSIDANSPVISTSTYFGTLAQCNTNTTSTVSIIDHTNCDTNMIQVPSAHPLSSGFNIAGDESGNDRLPMDVINNYFSFGVDAHIALEFHTAREAHPERFNSRLRNKMFYGQAGGKDLLKRKWKDLSNFVTLYCDGQDMTSRLKELKVHSVLFLNIPSYGGGTRPWPTTATSFAKPRTDDGLIEVIGLTTYQLPLLQAGGHGTCIAQCRSAKIITSRTIPMQVDGEPCKLLPSIININFKNRVCMLAKSKSSNKNTNITSGNIQKMN